MDSSIGIRIKMRRKEIGLTQPQVKQLTGISSGTLSDIENGKSLPATPSLIKLSKALDCSIDWILTGEFRQSEISISKQDSDVLDAFQKLAPRDQEEIMLLMQIKLQRDLGDTKKTTKSSISATIESDSLVG